MRDPGFFDEALDKRVRIKTKHLIPRGHVVLLLMLPEWERCRDPENGIVQFLAMLPWDQELVRGRAFVSCTSVG
jgi:hypothetical protein